MSVTELLPSSPVDRSPRNGARAAAGMVDLVDDRGAAPTVSVLGTFAFRAGPRAVVLTGGSRKLLALLALREQPIPRALAAYTLWPDAPDRDASCRLRSALCRLKNSVGDVVDTSGLDLQLRPEVAVDLRAARALAGRVLDAPETWWSEMNPAGCVRLLAGDLLPGWYDDWVLADGGEWHQQRMYALEAMAAGLAGARRWADATLAALAAVRADPLRESAHGALIKTFLAEGNQKEALDEYERVRRLLWLELGVEPSPQLTELVGDLRDRARAH